MKKKLLFLVVVFCFLGIGVQAQSTMGKGQFVGSARIGFSSWGLPLDLTADYGIVGGLIDGNASVSVGGQLGVYLYDNYYDGIDVYLSLAARGNFHYEFVENLDTYAGASIGVLGNELAVNGQLGARYYFGKFGLNLEFDLGRYTSGCFGVSMRF